MEIIKEEILNEEKKLVLIKCPFNEGEYRTKVIFTSGIHEGKEYGRLGSQKLVHAKRTFNKWLNDK